MQNNNKPMKCLLEGGVNNGRSWYWRGVQRLEEELADINSELEFYKYKKFYLKNEISIVDRILRETEGKKKNTEKEIIRAKKTKEESPGLVLIFAEDYYFDNRREKRWVIDKLELEHNEIIEKLQNLKTTDERFYIKRQKMLDRLNKINQELESRLNEYRRPFYEDDFFN